MQLGVSCNPICEALRTLGVLGMIEVRHGEEGSFYEAGRHFDAALSSRGDSGQSVEAPAGDSAALVMNKHLRAIEAFDERATCSSASVKGDEVKGDEVKGD